MKKTAPENGDLEQDNGVPDFERLMHMKVLSHERLAYQRGAWLAEYESLTPEEKAIVDAKFHKLTMKIAAQFGRSRPFIFEGCDRLQTMESDCDRSSEPN